MDQPTLIPRVEDCRNFWRRAGAMLVDFLLLAPLDVVFIWLLLNLDRINARGAAIPLYIVHATYTVLYSVVYHACFGQTFGKWCMRIRVVRRNGGRIGLCRAVLRDLPWILLASVDAWAGVPVTWSSLDPIGFAPLRSSWKVSAILGLVGAAWLVLGAIVALMNRRRRTHHDFLAGTIVVRVPRPDVPTGPVTDRAPEGTASVEPTSCGPGTADLNAPSGKSTGGVVPDENGH